MNAIPTSLSFASRACAFTRELSIEALRERVPAVFAPAAHESLTEKYTFIPTEQVLSGLMSAGLVPVEGRQAISRNDIPLHARHLLRLRRRFETVQFKDSIPENVFPNSHDGTSAYLLRVGSCATCAARGYGRSVAIAPR